MRALETSIPDALLIVADVHGDERGFFQETYRRETFARFGVTDDFVQHNHSRSARGVLRGMHLQTYPGISKLVGCARGEILDVVLDVRVGSPAYGRWESFRLDDVEHRRLYVPPGLAHGFCVLSDVADVIYAQSGYYDADRERSIAFDDPDVAIEWPLLDSLTVSERDRDAPALADIVAELGFSYAPAAG